MIHPLEDTEERIRKFVEIASSGGAFQPTPEALDSITSFLRDIMLGVIPDKYPVYSSSVDEIQMVDISLHTALCSVGYYGKITNRVASAIASVLSPDAVVLDPFAGKGYAAKAFRQVGIPTIATDDNSWQDSQVENLDALASLEKYGNQITTVLLSWLPSSGIDVKVVQKIRKEYPHLTLIHIGEGRGGCTGSEAYWDEVLEIPAPHIPYVSSPVIFDTVNFHIPKPHGSAVFGETL